MNDQELKNLFKQIRAEDPSPLQIARWKKVIRANLQDRTKGEWTRLAVACLFGVLIGATAFRPQNSQIQENFNEDATIEMVHVNLE